MKPRRIITTTTPALTPPAIAPTLDLFFEGPRLTAVLLEVGLLAELLEDDDELLPVDTVALGVPAQFIRNAGE
jgi:hypothetical protein